MTSAERNFSGGENIEDTLDSNRAGASIFAVPETRVAPSDRGTDHAGGRSSMPSEWEGRSQDGINYRMPDRSRELEEDAQADDHSKRAQQNSAQIRDAT
jgi:hypothetical protein